MRLSMRGLFCFAQNVSEPLIQIDDSAWSSCVGLVCGKPFLFSRTFHPSKRAMGRCDSTAPLREQISLFGAAPMLSGTHYLELARIVFYRQRGGNF